MIGSGLKEVGSGESLSFLNDFWLERGHLDSRFSSLILC